MSRIRDVDWLIVGNKASVSHRHYACRPLMYQANRAANRSNLRCRQSKIRCLQINLRYFHPKTSLRIYVSW